jgi:NadR type nicotinamide-nucleotide adenylyltransferase
MAKETNNIIRIALIGPESSAKSTLSEALAKHYHTSWVPEYSREYLKTIDRKYTLDDILKIAKEQLAQEQKKILSANKFIFADTELIISKVWCEDVFKVCPDWISENILKNKYDLSLLTYPDLPWENDPVRENPHRRQFFFDWYEKELKSIHANYTIIKGNGDERLSNCVDAIKKFLTNI